MKGSFPMHRLRPYDDLAAAWRALRGFGLRVREVACVGAPRTLLVAESGSATAPTVSIQAGVHGDEPAAPWALLGLARDGLLDGRFAYRIWACLNPGGYVAGTRANPEGDDVNRSFSRGGTTPEARAVITANRDRRFALALDLHEDYEADGTYVYEALAPGVAPRFAPRVVRALDDAGLPVQDLQDGYDLGTPPSDPPAFRLERGAVIVDGRAESRLFAGRLPSSLYHFRRGARTMTVETPLPRPWDERIAAHRIAITTALEVLAGV
jgi:hypothetical protein